MSVSNPVIDYLDTATKRIYLLAGVTKYHAVSDIYVEVRNRRRVDESLRKFDPPVSAEGNKPKGGGKYTPRYTIFNNGWRVVLTTGLATLDIEGEQITDDGQSGAQCIDFTLLPPGTSIVVNYEPPASELVRTEAEQAILTAVNTSLNSTQRMIEGLRPHHKGYGNIWYYDPAHGNDANDGKTPATAFLTMVAAHSAVTNFGHDVILIVPKGDGITLSTEPWVITKNFLFIRGMGFNAHVDPTSTTPGGNLIEISGNGVELSGLHIEGSSIAAPNCNGIVVTGTHVLIENVTVQECTGHGCVITTTAADDRAVINESYFRDNGKSGLQYNSGVHLEVLDSEFEENVEHGVDCTGTGLIEDTLFHHCNFLRNGGYGLNIDNANSVGVTIESECEFAFNGSGDYLDNGTDTIIQANDEANTAAEAVWANATGAAIAVRMAEAWGRLGLDPSKPLMTGQTQITFGQIVMALTGDATSTTVQRQ